MVGPRYITRGSSGLLRKVIWTFLILVGLAVMVHQMWGMVVYYLERPVAVNVNVVDNKSLTFPTVTICNENIAMKYETDKLGKSRVSQYVASIE